MMTIRDIIGKFNTTPFLFVGSGLTRRYLNLHIVRMKIRLKAWNVKQELCRKLQN